MRDLTVPLFTTSTEHPGPSANNKNPPDSLTISGSNASPSSGANNSANTDSTFKNTRDWLPSWFQRSAWSLEELLEDPMRLARRECYYVYYEIQPSGRLVQQVFCRGTTLKVDILTCLQAWTVYDEELQCRVHRGFRDQADRVLADYHCWPLHITLAPQWNWLDTVWVEPWRRWWRANCGTAAIASCV